MSKQFCSSCGNELPSTSKFCTQCGKGVGQETPQQATEPVQHNETQPEQTPNPNMKMYLYIGIAVAIAIIAYLFVGKNSPEKVAEDFVYKFASFELEDAKKLLTSDGDAWIHDEIDWMIDEMKEYPREAKEQIKQAKEEGFIVKDFKVTDKNKSKRSASITADVTMKNGDEDTVYIELEKESGKWKIIDVD